MPSQPSRPVPWPCCVCSWHRNVRRLRRVRRRAAARGRGLARGGARGLARLRPLQRGAQLRAALRQRGGGEPDHRLHTALHRASGRRFSRRTPRSQGVVRHSRRFPGGGHDHGRGRRGIRRQRWGAARPPGRRFGKRLLLFSEAVPGEVRVRHLHRLRRLGGSGTAYAILPCTSRRSPLRARGG